jgi:disulfide bond formation protein DsbB
MLDFKTMRLFFSLLALAADAAVVAAVVLAIGARFSAPLSRAARSLRALLAGWELPLAFLVATVSTLGSLYYSEIVNLVPCQYCWYQRIAMYPLVVVLGLAVWRRDRTVAAAAGPLASIGMLLAGYHYFIQSFPQFGHGQCSTTTPCNAAYFHQFGFVSIPYQALSGFALIVVVMTVARLNSRQEPAS